jgi:phosphoglycolate phosphatase
MAVATGKSRLGLNRSFEETGIGDFFVISRCADESVSKPHPQMLFDIQDALGIETSHMLMIGDSLYDLQMAQAAGAAAIGVCCGVHERLQMEALHPLACLETVASLPQWLHHHSSV